jgi:hypothetical protein
MVTLPLAAETRDLLSAARSAGEDHASIAGLHPVSAAVLPAVVAPCDMRRPGLQALLRHLPVERLCAIGAGVADVLERARLRGTWLWMFRWLAATAYARGFAVGRGPRCRRVALTIDVASTKPVPKPAIAASAVEVCLGGRRIATFRPTGGQWGRSLAHQVAARLDPEAWRQLGRTTASNATATAVAHDAVRLDDTLVVFGPGNRPGDDRHAPELTAAGARVLRLAGHQRDHWSAIAAAIADAPEAHAAVVLPGVSGDAEWLATARVPLAGDRVALACGTGVPRGSEPLPTMLVSRSISSGLYQPIAVAPQFAVLSTRRLAQLGGIDPSTAALGMHSPLIDLIERALEAGLVVANQETPGIHPPGSVRPTRSRLAWERAWARGGLLARAAIERGPIRGSGLLAGHLVVAPVLWLSYSMTSGQPSARVIAGTSAAQVSGCVHALSRYARWRVARGPAPGNTESIG